MAFAGAGLRTHGSELKRVPAHAPNQSAGRFIRMTDNEFTSLARKIWSAAEDKFDADQLANLHTFLTKLKEDRDGPHPDPSSLAAVPSSLLLAELGLRIK